MYGAGEFGDPFQLEAANTLSGIAMGQGDVVIATIVQTPSTPPAGNPEHRRGLAERAARAPQRGDHVTDLANAAPPELLTPFSEGADFSLQSPSSERGKISKSRNTHCGLTVGFTKKHFASFLPFWTPI